MKGGRAGGQIEPPPQEKLPSKSPALLELMLLITIAPIKIQKL